MAARINGSMVTMPMAQAAASCMNEDANPRLIAMIKVNLVTLLPAFLIIKIENEIKKEISGFH